MRLLALPLAAALCACDDLPVDPHTDPALGPAAGNPGGGCAPPLGAGEEDVSMPRTVVGDGTPASCTSDAFVAAVAGGGVITFDCGPDPVVIPLDETARVFNDSVTSAEPDVVIDGGGLVTLSGRGRHRILYMNTCDPDLVWTTSHCNDQDHPELTVQNLTFVDGLATSGPVERSGGAIFARGGRLKIVNSRFFHNYAANTGPDVGGGAVRVFDQSMDLPVFVVNSTFGGPEGYGNVASNGGALSSIGVSFSLVNSLFVGNEAIGYGANPRRAGTPGGGSGGAVYNDGNTFTLSLCGVSLTDNHAREGGGALFFVSNDRSGTLRITDSSLTRNPSAGFETAGLPGIFYLGMGAPVITASTLSP